MLFNNLPICCGTYLLLSALLWLFAGYAYFVDLRRPTDDPQKKNYNFNAIFLAPISWPFLLSGWFVILVLRVLLFGVILVLFTLALIFFRKPFWLLWLDKIATKIGGKLLDVNSNLINLAFGKSTSNA